MSSTIVAWSFQLSIAEKKRISFCVQMVVIAAPNFPHESISLSVLNFLSLSDAQISINTSNRDVIFHECTS